MRNTRKYRIGFPYVVDYLNRENDPGKPSNCFYLKGYAKERICQNKNCPQFGGHCFNATNCMYRAKMPRKTSKKSEKKTQNPEKNLFREYTPDMRRLSEQSAAERKAKKKAYILVPNCGVIHKSFGRGIFLRLEEEKENRYMIVRFGEEEKQFAFPGAMEKGILRIAGEKEGGKGAALS